MERVLGGLVHDEEVRSALAGALSALAERLRHASEARGTA
jgi:hypothetical protein